MECHACGTTVVEGQKFCQECGQSLHGVTDTTERLDGGAEDPADEATADEPVLPDLSELPTKEINPRPPLPDPTWAPREEPTSPSAPFDDLTTQTPAHPMYAIGTDAAAAPPADAAAADRPAAGADHTAPRDDVTSQIAVTGAGAAGAGAPDTDEVAVAEVTTVMAAADRVTTDEIPAVFDGSDDVRHFPPPREPFKLRIMFVLAFFGTVAALMSSAADVTDIRTSTPVDGINTGITTLSDIGVNLPVAGFTGAAVMTVGGLLACFGYRWGAGLAGGGGLALAGWAGLTIGLAEAPIAVAESITRTSSQAFTLTVTRDLGFWLIIAVGGLGLLVFAASLRLAGMGGRRSLNPWIAAVGAVSTVVLAAGPLLPEGAASFADNFRSTDVLRDLPIAYFGGRVGQVALIAFAGVVGFLLVRVYGLGLVAGGISVGVWLWLSSLLGIGEKPATGEQPLGIAAGNFGAGDTSPHGVTTVGMVLTLLMLLVATVTAIVQFQRSRRTYPMR